MSSFWPRVNSIWRVPLILSMTAVMATLSVTSSLFDPSGRVLHWWARMWGRFIIFVSRVKVKVSGLDQIDPKRGYVFMPNHLSMFDHWAFLAELPMQFRFAAKASLFKIPFLGWHLGRAGNIPVDRYHPRETVRRFREIGKRIRSGLSVVIYPEGARTWGDEMAPFKRGAFMLAKHAKAPIVPVTIIGAHRRLARGSFIIHPGEMELIFHPAVEFEDYRGLKLETLSDNIRKAIQSRYRQVPA